MRKAWWALIALVVVSACANTPQAGSSSPPASPGTSPSASASPSATLTAADCAAAATLVAPGGLTIGTDNPAFSPYFMGGETKEHKEWQFNDPYTGKGFEDAVAYEMASRLGYSADQVTWTVAPFGQLFKPGAKDFDVAIEQIGYNQKRANAVDLTDSYYDVARAVVARKGTPITQATSIADLQQYRLATQIGTTDYDFITDVIQPTKEPGAYNSLADAVAAINAHQVDGLVVDLPTALYMADPFVQQVKNSVVVGQFPPQAESNYFSMALAKGSAFTACVNLAIQEMKDDGTLQSITDEWLSKQTNVGEVPTFSS
jgi:polar amino acid transport system substrate-binding protein